MKRLILKRIGAFVLCLVAANALQGLSIYAEQINALKKSFDEKKIDPVQEYVGEELKFGAYPAGATVQILTQVFANLPKLEKLEVTNEASGEAEVRYTFVALGKRESKILFSQDGKITKLELVDNLLREQAEAQRQLAEQKQAPTPGALAEQFSFEEIEFPSKDGLTITGNLYEIGPDEPVILLCHQAGYNKYEYADIAPKLNQMGYNVLAIDQRSGGSFANNGNATSDRAKAQNLEVEFVDAEQDIEAAVDFLSSKYRQEIILWGSSYSSALSLFVGQSNNHVKAIISFSPGDYFGESKPSLSTVFAKLDKPFLVTSSKRESETLASLLKRVQLKEDQWQFIPEGAGYHGSRALWEGQKGGDEYWTQIKKFLSDIDRN